MDVPTQMSEYKVEVYAWKLQLIPKTVHRALPRLADVTDGKFPKEILHVGVAVYKRLYHYNQTGIQINVEVAAKYKKCGSIQYTKKSHGELEKWISEQRDIKYSYSNYNIGNNNCITFAQDVCSFLEVSFEGPQKDLDDWLQSNPNMVRRLERFLSNSVLQFFGLVPKKQKRRTYVDSNGSTEDDYPYNYVAVEYDNGNYESDDDEAEFTTID